MRQGRNNFNLDLPINTIVCMWERIRYGKSTGGKKERRGPKEFIAPGKGKPYHWEAQETALFG